MNVFFLFQALLTILLFSCHAIAELKPLEEALVDAGLTLYAQHLKENYPVAFGPGRDGQVLFAISNSGMQRFLDELEAEEATEGSLHSRDPQAQKEQRLKHSVSQGGGNVPQNPSSVGAQGATGKTDGGTVQFYGAGQKKGKFRVRDDVPYSPPDIWVGQVGSGGGALSYITEDRRDYTNGSFYVVDLVFHNNEGFIETVRKFPELAYLDAIFKRIPHALPPIQDSRKITFFAPPEDAFKAAGFDVVRSKDHELKAFLNDHMIKNGLIGYTSAFKNGREYSTRGGKKFVHTFNGTHTLFDDGLPLPPVTITNRNLLISNGVVQIIDRVLFRCPKNSLKGKRHTCR